MSDKKIVRVQEVMKREFDMVQGMDTVAGALKAARHLETRCLIVDVRDENRRTSLFFASIQGNEDFVELLLRFNPKVNAIDKFGSSPLFYAAAGNHVGVIEMLVEKGAPLNVQNRQGLTALMIAASEGHLAAVQALIDLKADTEFTDFTGRTAYDWANRNNRRAVIRYLKSVGIGG